jgi:predicted ATP-binding protein involved in virulence
MLPIALKSFCIKGYKGIIETEVNNIPPDTQWIFLTGENGFGKTSVLQGIVSLIYTHENIETQSLRPLQGIIEILKNGVSYYHPPIVKDMNHINKDGRREILMSVNDFTAYNDIIAYGSTRLRISAGSALEVMDKYNPTQSLFSNETLMINIEDNFKDWEKDYEKGYTQLENIFKTLIPRLDKIKVEFDSIKKIKVVKYYETDDSGKPFGFGVSILDLATGFRNIIAMIGDMINRFSKTQTVENYSDLKGIVIIDEFDIHLHPKYQKLFVQKLTELFPKIQFIVSTHSPIPLLGAPKNSVIINVSRTREEGIKAELLDIDFSVLTPNAILSSPIFGFQDLIPESKSDDKMIRTEDTFQEVEFNDQLKKNINEFLTEDRQKELLNLLKIKAL